MIIFLVLAVSGIHQHQIGTKFQTARVKLSATNLQKKTFFLLIKCMLLHEQSNHDDAATCAQTLRRKTSTRGPSASGRKENRPIKCVLDECNFP
mmetsp:Transcript_22999/g.32119  ORF Transcript_22999/g.32119 Transcript_22999/m.32119 type:complete len:94 (-) Transcript_22999:217-498(-)